ncbi:MAG: hypothetical protein GY774_16670 [Planctomycetes bacterium]|nr:hypothetical protein [Planctomycetota bacterium]
MKTEDRFMNTRQVLQAPSMHIDYKPEIKIWIAWITDGSSIFNKDNIKTFESLRELLGWASDNGVKTSDIIAYL